MKRITPEQVVEAYKQRGWRPRRSEWAVIDAEGNNCGCGLAVVAGFDIYQLFEKLNDYNTVHHSVVMANELDLNLDYVTGYTAGFDGLAAEPWMDEETCRIGYEDGAAAWEAVSKEVIS